MDEISQIPKYINRPGGRQLRSFSSVGLQTKNVRNEEKMKSLLETHVE